MRTIDVPSPEADAAVADVPDDGTDRGAGRVRIGEDERSAAVIEPVRLRVSVGHLAAFVHRRGDLHAVGGASVRPLEGLRRQQRHQAAADERTRSEVRLTGTWSDARAVLEIGGRADGVVTGPGGVRIEEIKTHRGPAVAAHARDGAVHEAQLRLYGALWLLAGAGAPDEGAPGEGAPIDAGATRTPALRLLYLDADSEAVYPVDLHVDVDADALARFLDATCRAYVDWMTTELARRRARDAALATLAFPHPFRPGQQSLARAVWQILGRGGTLLAEAPTGIGKTLGTLYGALRRLPTLRAERVLYLTVQGSNRRLALDAAGLLARDGAPLRAVELLARERICPTPEVPCRADACTRARGHHDRRRDALAMLLGHGDERAEPVLDAARVAQVAERHHVCPAALQQDAARFADLVVGDVNFALDPFARRGALIDADDGGAVALVDEVHNLTERGRAMWSAALDGGALRDLRSATGGAAGPLRRPLDVLLRRLGSIGDETPSAPSRTVEGLVEASRGAAEALSAWLAEAPGGAVSAGAQRTLGELLRFVECAEAAAGEDGEAWVLETTGAGATRGLAIRCLCPAPRLGPALAGLDAVVGFSATLAPAGVHRLTLGLPETTRGLTVGDPFPPARRLLLHVDDLDLRARRREGHLDAVVRTIADLVAARAGHYLVFAPSYAVLEALDVRLASVLPGAERIRQSARMDEAARRDFVAAFEHPDGRTRLGLAVSGGLFAEGLDLPGERLVGVILVGLPLPAPDVERQALRDYHRARGRDGDAIAFHVPAVTRLRQAAGRLIRDAADAGVVCLIDARLTRPEFRDLLPADWRCERLPAAAAGARARRFWSALADTET